MTEVYSGVPWRSRFLRAPKVAFELSARKDFTPLGILADARLGLKTGCDKFFYLTRVGPSKPASIGGSPAFEVSGLSGEWIGFIAARDLLQAALNPHKLLAGRQRAFLIPRGGDTFYLHPRGTQLRAQLGDYVHAGERALVNRMKLVQANASAKRWFLQVRGVIRSP